MILGRIACFAGIHGELSVAVPLDSGLVLQCERCGRHVLERTAELRPPHPVAIWTYSRKHLVEAGQGYLQHLRFATLVGVMAVAAGVACLIHALVPALCPRTCSRTIGQLNQLFSSPHRWREALQQSWGVVVFLMLVTMAGAIAALPVATGAPSALAALLAALALGIPATFLLTNPDLELVED